MAGERPLDESPWQRARADTAKVRHGMWFVDTILAGLIVAAIGYFLDRAESNDFILWFVPAFSFVGIVVWFVVLAFGWNILRAPYRQRDELRATATLDEVQQAVAKMSSETKEAFIRMSRQLRTSYVSGNVKQRPQLEELRRLGLVDVSREDAGWWNRDRHKGMLDIFRLNAAGGSALDVLEGNDLERAVAKLSEQGRTYLLAHGERVASAVDALEIAPDVRNELTLAGITESEIAPISDPVTGAGSSKEVWKLTPFGKRVVRRLRELGERRA